MTKYIYPAIFNKEEELYSVIFPDLESCYTQGDNLQDAMEMAEDVLCMTLYEFEESGSEIPTPSEVNEIPVKNAEFVSLVTCDTLEYRQFYDNKAVKKTLTIPSWLNTMSEREGINFSSVLQDALKERLSIHEDKVTYKAKPKNRTDY